MTSPASYDSEAPVHSIISRMSASIERTMPAPSIVVHMEANRTVELLVIHEQPPNYATSEAASIPSKLFRKVLRVLEWALDGISQRMLIV